MIARHPFNCRRPLLPWRDRKMPFNLLFFKGKSESPNSRSSRARAQMVHPLKHGNPSPLTHARKYFLHALSLEPKKPAAGAGVLQQAS